MMKYLNIVLILHLLIVSVSAQKKESAEELIASKEKADMTYQEMMQIMSINAKKIKARCL